MRNFTKAVLVVSVAFFTSWLTVDAALAQNTATNCAASVPPEEDFNRSCAEAAQPDFAMPDTPLPQ